MSDLRRAAELCEFCPKMCRFSCPVSEATSREALSPWGKVSLAALCGDSPPPPAAEAFAGCTGCFRCQSYCAHANDVPRVLYAARASSVRAGTGLPAWNDVAARFARSGHAKDEDLLAVRRSIQQPSQAAPQAILFAGCDALAQGGELVQAALAVARELGAPLELAPEGALCCGLELVEAGHPDEFAAHAKRVRSALGPRPAKLVFLSPGCARAARERWPALPSGSTVEHVTTYLARAIATRSDHLADRPPLPISVVWHDPCELSRGLAELTAPRALLALAVEEVREPVRTGADTSCCGAAGLLPRSLPAVAEGIAAQRRAELDACGAAPVTASPACARALSATDLVVLVSRWLGISGSAPAWRKTS
ncbi:MAG: (Fe-S)-binding protein [Myxococcales bacterium]